MKKYLCCVWFCVYAEQRLGVAPALAYTDWSGANSLSRLPGADWDAGRYQGGLEFSWHRFIAPMFFTGMRYVILETTTVRWGDHALKPSYHSFSVQPSEYSVYAGMRYAFGAHETRLWWGIAGRKYGYDRSIVPPEPAAQASVVKQHRDWTVNFGASYGTSEPNSPWSWHFGWLVTPGSYDVFDGYKQLPTRSLFFLRAERAIA